MDSDLGTLYAVVYTLTVYIVISFEEVAFSPLNEQAISFTSQWEPCIRAY